MRDSDGVYRRLIGAIVVVAVEDAVKGESLASKWLKESAPRLMNLAGLDVNFEKIDDVVKSGLPWRQIKAGREWRNDKRGSPGEEQSASPRSNVIDPRVFLSKKGDNYAEKMYNLCACETERD
jgi:hypothetical protein